MGVCVGEWEGRATDPHLPPSFRRRSLIPGDEASARTKISQSVRVAARTPPQWGRT